MSYSPPAGLRTVTGVATPSSLLNSVIVGPITGKFWIAWARAASQGVGNDNGIFALQLLADDGATWNTATSGGIVPPAVFNTSNYWSSLLPFAGGMLFGGVVTFSVANVVRPFQARWIVTTVPTLGSTTLGFDFM